MIKASFAAGIALFVALFVGESLIQGSNVLLSPDVRGILVAACGKDVSQTTDNYCTVVAAAPCTQDMSIVTLTCTGGTASNWNLKTGCTTGSSKTECTTHPGAKLATEAGNYKLVDGAVGSCGAWTGNKCKTTANPQTAPCGHAGHAGKTISWTEQICGDDPNNPTPGGNCAGVVKNAGGC
jgi:hypothetical protein